MTTPNGAIVFSTSAGSDTLSSGLGPATAVNGSGASTTAASAVVTGINTTGVSAGDLLWVQSSSGRQFSIIASVDSGTQVTCDDTFANTESSRTWAIGGKRATWDNSDSRNVFSDADDKGWTIETETDQTLTSAIDMAGTGLVTIRGSSSTLRTITQTVDAAHFNQGSLGLRGATFQYLKGANSFGGTKTSASSFIYHANSGTSALPFKLENCELGDATNSLYHGVQRQASSMFCLLIDCYIHDCIGNGIINAASSSEILLERCRVIGNGGDGVQTSGNQARSLIVIDSLFAGNTGNGVSAVAAATHLIFRSAFYNNGGSGLELGVSAQALVLNSVFSDNAAYGINDSTGGDADYFRVVGCLFYNNTSGSLQTASVPSGSYEASTDDPFTDSANYDFTLGTGTDATAIKAETGLLFNDATTSRPYRWLDTSAGSGATNVAAAKFTRLE